MVVKVIHYLGINNVFQHFTTDTCKCYRPVGRCFCFVLAWLKYWCDKLLLPVTGYCIEFQRLLKNILVNIGVIVGANILSC